MSQDEQKQAEQTATTEPSTVEKKDVATPSEGQDSQESNNSSIDYKAKLEKERSRREKAENKLKELRLEKKEAGTQEERDDIEARIAALEENFNQKLEEKTKELEMRSEQRRYDDAVAAVSSSDDEMQLIKHILENDIKPTGDIERDVRRAKLLANEDSYMSELEEAKLALATRKTVGSIPSSGQRVSEDKAQWTEADRKFAAAAGLDLKQLGKRK